MTIDEQITASDGMKRQFASLYVYGVSMSKALIGAGFSTRSTALGLTLLQDPVVIKAIDETRQHVLAQIAMSKSDILLQLQQDRDFAYETNNPSAAVAATMAQAKVLGMLDPDSASRLPKRIVVEFGDDYGFNEHQPAAPLIDGPAVN